MYKKISDYGIIGNLHTVALIGVDGSIDWLCLPHLDSPSIFGALLDDNKGGRFSISPAGEWDSVAEYEPGTNILHTRFRTRTGILRVTDFMPVCACGREEREEASHELYRRVEVLKGTVRAIMHFDPRFDYARAGTRLERIENGLVAHGNNKRAILLSTRSLNIGGNEMMKVEWDIAEGERIWLCLSYGTNGQDRLDISKAEKALDDTASYWKDWVGRSETGRVLDLGSYAQMVERSALVLKLLSYDPGGNIAAAATTSLPEVIGGMRNWDYRYTWVRDTSFTLQALFNLGHMSETEGYIRWIEKLISEHGVENMQIMYGLRGEIELPEEELLHLEGYKGSRPVRTGNGAAGQKQLDIYGELMDAALKLSDYVGKIDADLWPFLRSICEHVTKHWKDRDSGIWEVRGGPYHFVYSKVMCWVALDRGIIIAQRYGFPGDTEKWKNACDKIRAEVLDRGWNTEKAAFVQHYETDALDSSNLLIPILGFLQYTDPRVISNINATQRELGHDGFLYRYKGDDGLSGEEGTFLLCTFWLINNLIAAGRVDEAEKLLHKVEGTANHLGLFSEEYDVTWKEPLGNFPQAFTHIGYINSVTSLCQSRQMQEETGRTVSFAKKLLAGSIVLNNGEPRQDIPSNDIVRRLKDAMNVLRGAFFDTTKGRVAYERMRASQAYHEYLELSYTLKKMDFDALKTDRGKTAFWVNLYNVIVIHGVIELDIKDSVREVRNFFRRIRYRVGDMLFSPEEIEHGILRGNRRPPNSMLRVFRENDARLKYSVERPDPRIHFALVCASSSCPPIDIYTVGKLDKELDIAGKAFINGGGLVLNRKDGSLSLSRVFKWYARDFGSTTAERLRFIAQYLYDKDDRRNIMDNAENVKIEYQDYDWRLNRY